MLSEQQLSYVEQKIPEVSSSATISLLLSLAKVCYMMITTVNSNHEGYKFETRLTGNPMLRLVPPCCRGWQWGSGAAVPATDVVSVTGTPAGGCERGAGAAEAGIGQGTTQVETPAVCRHRWWCACFTVHCTHLSQLCFLTQVTVTQSKQLFFLGSCNCLTVCKGMVKMVINTWLSSYKWFSFLLAEII